MSAERGIPDPAALWTSGVFVEEARAWVAAQLLPRGSRLTGDWEQPHARVWSSTIWFETTEGRVWFKVSGSGTAYEPALIALLGELRPGLAPDVIAHDDNRGWSLTRDGGPILRSVVAPDALWPYWERLLPRYAEAQLALAEHRPRLLSTGTPDLGPAQLPVEYRRLLAELTARSTAEGGLSQEHAAVLERLLPAYDSWCAELAASPVPDSLQHDDLHSSNVCWPGNVNDLSSVRITDWGDASVGNPLGTMLATLNSIAFHAGVLHADRRMDDPRMLRIQDAYLEPFTSLGSRKELLRWVTLARSTGCVTRAVSWESALLEAPATVVAAEEFPVRGWLLELLEPWADVD
ncbi:MAG TPA: phosphotransferase [Propionibacteriaceae bacterium]|nr:phosphotransferase [Propionibacteriaceae bacterium]